MSGSNAKSELQALLDSLKGDFEDVKDKSKNDQYGDNRFLRLSNGKTTVRILPPKPGSGQIQPWIKKFIHSFESMATGGFETFDCPWTYRQPCKICQNNSRLWNEGDDSSIGLARKFKRKVAYATNAYVLETEGDDKNIVGEIKILRFGKKIYDKLVDALEMVGMFYDPVNGADFIIVKRQLGEYPNYDSSMFVNPGTRIGNMKDAEIMKIMDGAHDLKQFEAQIDENDPNLEKVFRQHCMGEESVEEKPPLPLPDRPSSVDLDEKTELKDQAVAKDEENPAGDVVDDNVAADAVDDADFLAELDAELDG